MSNGRTRRDRRYSRYILNFICLFSFSLKFSLIIGKVNVNKKEKFFFLKLLKSEYAEVFMF